MFESSVYKSRRLKLREKLGDRTAIIIGHGLTPRNYRDNTYDFRQNSTFLYFIGLKIPDMAFISTPDGDFLAGTEPTVDDIIWSGPLPGLKDLAARAGIEKTVEIKELPNFLNKYNKIHYLPLYREEDVTFLSEITSTIRDKIPGGYSTDLLKFCVDIRLKKEGIEILEIEKALSASYDMYNAASRVVKAGAGEFDVMASMKNAALLRKCEMSFTPIVSVRGEVLHNHSYDNTLEDGQMILLDSGAETLEGYASDITRTWPVNGVFSPLQKDLYTVVLDSWKKAVSLVKPGVTMTELHLAAARVITNGLKDMGIMKGNPEDAVREGAHALFFPHGLGHMMGLDVHDMEDLGDYVGYGDDFRRSSQFGLAFLRMGRILEKDYVFTIEPGIYFIDALIDSWQMDSLHSAFIDYEKVNSLRGFGGIRIEDDILVTENGGRILGQKEIPREIQDVENLLKN
ncbi:MAG: aminopeptidase P family protein [Deltaproteobacteria bacterium]|nr:aminopeptidase P family protein [Deltaproteobacteria bacterium]